MSALVSPRGLASPSRSARFSSACREMQKPAQLGSRPSRAPLRAPAPQQSDPKITRPTTRREAEPAHLIILHLHIIHVQV